MMLLAIALLMAGWWCCRHARQLERAAHGMPTMYMDLVIEGPGRPGGPGRAEGGGRNGSRRGGCEGEAGPKEFR